MKSLVSTGDGVLKIDCGSHKQNPKNWPHTKLPQRKQKHTHLYRCMICIYIYIYTHYFFKHLLLFIYIYDTYIYIWYIYIWYINMMIYIWYIYIYMYMYRSFAKNWPHPTKLLEIVPPRGQRQGSSGGLFGQLLSTVASGENEATGARCPRLELLSRCQ